MRNAFIRRIDNLTQEYETARNDFRKQLFYIDEDLKKEKYVKEIFLRQINELQKNLK